MTAAHVITPQPGSNTDPNAERCTPPRVSIIMPVRNEEAFILQVIEAAFQQDYPPHLLELLIVDGMSTDRTRERVEQIAKQKPNLRLIDNPEGIVPTAFNRALKVANGDIIVRMDGHCEYPSDYVTRVVKLREEHQADNLGGVLEPVGSTATQQAVCEAYRSRVGLGGAALRAHGMSDPNQVEEVDAVHGGCWRKQRLIEIGGMDEAMVRNQDDELSFRLRKSGGRILQCAGIRVLYHVRGSFSKLFQQFAQYGYWKVRVVRKHPQQSSLRHFVPGLFVSLTLLGLILGPWWWPAGAALIALWFCYLSVAGLATFLQLRGNKIKLWPGTLLALTLMHTGYGTGFLIGWIRSLLGPLPTDRFFEKVTR